jgi:hypothetical protein
VPPSTPQTQLWWPLAILTPYDSAFKRSDYQLSFQSDSFAVLVLSTAIRMDTIHEVDLYRADLKYKISLVHIDRPQESLVEVCNLNILLLQQE